MELGKNVGGVDDRAHYYASAEKAVKNIFGYIYSYAEIIPQYLALFYLYKNIIVKNILQNNYIYIVPYTIN